MHPTSLAEAAEAVERLRECGRRLRANMAQVIVGQDAVVDTLTTGLMCGGHMLLVGVPGLAKTLMVRTLAQTLGWTFRRVQFTPDLMPADITGTEILQGANEERRLVFHPGPLFANLVLADEINRTPPKTQAALLEAMQERSVTVSGCCHPLPAPFVVVATQNPIEQEGTYPLPEAQLDRFLFSIHVGYPERAQERAIAARPARMEIPEIAPVATPEEFLSFSRIVDAVPVADAVLDYAVALACASRPQDASAPAFVKTYVNWGMGPRGCQHLVRGQGRGPARRPAGAGDRRCAGHGPAGDAPSRAAQLQRPGRGPRRGHPGRPPAGGGAGAGPLMSDPAPFAGTVLDLHRMEMLRRCRLRPRGTAEGSFAGPHRSQFRGTAVEFADYRDYVPGDDIRLLDWKLLARSDRQYVRCYESERNLLSYLVLDTSGS